MHCRLSLFVSALERTIPEVVPMVFDDLVPVQGSCGSSQAFSNCSLDFIADTEWRCSAAPAIPSWLNSFASEEPLHGNVELKVPTQTPTGRHAYAYTGCAEHRRDD